MSNNNDKFNRVVEKVKDSYYLTVANNTVVSVDDNWYALERLRELLENPNNMVESTFNYLIRILVDKQTLNSGIDMTKNRNSSKSIKESTDNG
jgi:hypothetical protein